MVKLPVTVDGPLAWPAAAPNFNIDVAVLRLRSTADKGTFAAPLESVTPAPAPIVKLVVLRKPPVPVKVIKVVGVKVPSQVAVGHVNVPEVCVKPVVNTSLVLVVMAVVVKVPVLVTRPVKVVVPAPSASVIIPALVVGPVTVKFPVVLMFSCELATVVKVPLTVDGPLTWPAAAPRFNIEVAVLKLRLAADKGTLAPPLESVTPKPAPMVKVVVLRKPPVPVKVIAAVGVKVPSQVAVGQVNVPEACVKPAVNTIFVFVVTLVVVKVPPLLVTKPVKVVIPVLLLSVKLSAKVVVPLTVKLPDVVSESGDLAPTVKFPEMVKLIAPGTVFVPDVGAVPVKDKFG